VPSSGPLQGLAIEGQTEALANLYSATSAVVAPTGALGLSVPAGSAAGTQAKASLPELTVGG
jgi:hypothetical protein